MTNPISPETINIIANPDGLHFSPDKANSLPKAFMWESDELLLWN